MKELFSNPLIIAVAVEILALIIAKLDKSNTLSGWLRKLVDKLDSK